MKLMMRGSALGLFCAGLVLGGCPSDPAPPGELAAEIEKHTQGDGAIQKGPDGERLWEGDGPPPWSSTGQGDEAQPVAQDNDPAVGAIRGALLAQAREAQNQLTPAAQRIRLHDDSPRINLPEPPPAKTTQVYLPAATVLIPPGLRGVQLRGVGGALSLGLTLPGGGAELASLSGNAEALARFEGLVIEAIPPWSELAPSLKAAGVNTQDQEAARGQWERLIHAKQKEAINPLGIFRAALSAQLEDLTSAVDIPHLFDAAWALRLKTEQLTAPDAYAAAAPTLVVAGPTVGVLWHSPGQGGEVTMAGPDGALTMIRFKGDVSQSPMGAMLMGSLRPYEVGPSVASAQAAQAASGVPPVMATLHLFSAFTLDPSLGRAQALLQGAKEAGGLPAAGGDEAQALIHSLAFRASLSADQQSTLVAIF